MCIWLTYSILTHRRIQSSSVQCASTTTTSSNFTINMIKPITKYQYMALNLLINTYRVYDVNLTHLNCLIAFLPARIPRLVKSLEIGVFPSHLSVSCLDNLCQNRTGNCIRVYINMYTDIVYFITICVYYLLFTHIITLFDRSFIYIKWYFKLRDVLLTGFKEIQRYQYTILNYNEVLWLYTYDTNINQRLLCRAK